MDASYLSPNVNMAARLETATKQYGVPILMSDHFAALLSPDVRLLCRQIDCVTVKGSTQPTGIWTIDLDSRHMTVDRFPNASDKRNVHFSYTSPDGVPGTTNFFNHADITKTYRGTHEFLTLWNVRRHPNPVSSCLRRL